MAIQFDEIDDRFAIADHASLTLQDGNWCVGIWTFVADNSGTQYQYLVSNGGYGANNSFNLFLQETDWGGADDDCWGFNVQDGDGTNVTRYSPNPTGGDSLWRLLIVQRNTALSRIALWYCRPGQAAVLQVSGADTGFNAVDRPNSLFIGCRQDLNTVRYYGGIACEFFKGNFALSQAEIEALGAGNPIHSLGYSPDIYLPMTDSVATLRDLFGGNNGVRNSAPTSVEHAPVRTVAGAGWWNVI